MKYLLDTNVISELIKREINIFVKRWFQSNSEIDLYLSVVTINELYYGVFKNKNNSKRIFNWIEQDLKDRFFSRIFSIDIEIAEKAAEFMTIKPNKVQDSYIAATAYVSDLPLVTRNIKDFNDFNIKLINPFKENNEI